MNYAPYMFPLNVIRINMYQSFTERGKELNFKKSPLSLSVQSKLVSIESDLLSSHQKEKMFEESLAVTKISLIRSIFSDMQINLVCVLVKLVLFMIKREFY